MHFRTWLWETENSWDSFHVLLRFSPHFHSLILFLCFPLLQPHVASASPENCPHTVSVLSYWVAWLWSQQHTNFKSLPQRIESRCISMVLFWYPGQTTLLQCVPHVISWDVMLPPTGEMKKTINVPKGTAPLSFCTRSHLACQLKWQLILVCHITAWYVIS